MGCGCNYSGGGYNNAAGSDAQVIKEGTPGVVGSREATFSEGMVVTSTRRGPWGPTVVGYPAKYGYEMGRPAVPFAEGGGRGLPANVSLPYDRSTPTNVGMAAPFNTHTPREWRGKTEGMMNIDRGRAGIPLGINIPWEKNTPTNVGMGSSGPVYRPLRSTPTNEGMGSSGPVYRPLRSTPTMEYSNASGRFRNTPTNVGMAAPFNTPRPGWGKNTPTNVGMAAPFNTPIPGWGKTAAGRSNAGPFNQGSVGWGKTSKNFGQRLKGKYGDGFAG
jgi:hypothetical protein